MCILAEPLLGAAPAVVLRYGDCRRKDPVDAGDQCLGSRDLAYAPYQVRVPAVSPVPAPCSPRCQRGRQGLGHKEEEKMKSPGYESAAS